MIFKSALKVKFNKSPCHKSTTTLVFPWQTHKTSLPRRMAHHTDSHGQKSLETESQKKNLYLLQEGERGQLNESTSNFRNALILYDTHACKSPGTVLQRHKHFSCEQTAARFLPQILAHPKHWSRTLVFSHLILQIYSLIHLFPWTTF